MLLLMSQCGVKDISRSFGSDQANRLLSADASKAWTLVSRIVDEEEVFGPCLENNTLTFVKASAGDSLYQMGRLVTCGSTSIVDTLYKAKYALVTSGTQNIFEDSITMTQERHLTIGTFKVTELTSNNLNIIYVVDGQTVQERYSN